MKAVIITRKIAIIILVVIICISSITYFSSISEIAPVSYLGAIGGGVSYSKIPLNLIIDPGHGGYDGGAVSDRGTVESVINLEIALRLEQLCGFLGFETVMTRNSEEIEYPPQADTIKTKKTADQKARLALINDTENAVLISIHQNCYPDERPFGAQVLYAPTDGSKEFGEYMQNMMLQHLIPNNRRTASLISENIYLMNNISCPAVLIECGFISNYSEEKLLNTHEYQLKIATVAVSCYAEKLELFLNLYEGVHTNEK